MTLLDCGCATGSITVGLAKVVAPGQVTGVDISDIEIERAQARAAEAGLPNICFTVGNIYQLDFPNNSFDALFSHNVLEHVAEPARALREMYRVLKPGGVVGIRDIDMGGVLLAPADKRTEQSFAIFEADWAGVSGHPRLGRHLGGLLIEAGFVEVMASASYEVYSDLEGRRFIGQLGVSRWSEADFVKRIIERELASYDEIEAIKEAWRAWPELPDAFFANAHGEAIGRKLYHFDN
jgi:SAM-dependent methyltransferase